MKIKNLVVTHHAQIISDSQILCGYHRFGATSNGKLRVHFKCKDYSKSPVETTENQFIEYDVSNILPGITYSHGQSSNLRLIEGIKIVDDTLYVDVHDHPDGNFEEYFLSGLSDSFKYVGFDYAPELPAELTHTAVFPPPETKAEWVDRMERILAHCAQNFEAAMGSLYPQHYTRLHDAATAKPSTSYLVRQTNTSVHCRWQIGWFWERVDRIKRSLPTVYTQAKLEPMIQAVYENMKTPQHIKMFFHKHDTQEWSKLRNQSSSTGENKRHISAWASDYTEGTNFADLTARSTIGGHFNEQSADASMFEYGVTEYTKAARHPKWDLITERVY